MVGVDRLSLSFRAGWWEADPAGWSTVAVSSPGTPRAIERRNGKARLANGVEVFVGLQEVPARGERWGKVEFNPARVVDPEGWRMASVTELPGAVSEAMAAAAEVVRPAGAVGEAKVRRVDAGVDFEGVTRPHFFVQGLAPLPRPWARRNLVHADPQKGGAQTLMVGSGAGVARLYDKWEETRGKAPAGTLRWEVEARRDWCSQYGGIECLADIDSDAVGRLVADRWEWSAMGVEVAATDRVIEAVQSSGLSPAQQRGFLGWCLLSARGYSSPLAKHTSTDYRRLARQLGITLSGEAFGSDTFTARLDFATGREVVRVA